MNEDHSEWYSGTWITTRHGHRFELAAPTPEMVDVRDIAYHLAGINRYCGATRYTVAQHCVLASLHVVQPSVWTHDNPNGPCECGAWHEPGEVEDPVLLRRWALLHDAEEAYTNDLSRPLKKLLQLRVPGVWAAIVAPIRAAIMTRFGLPLEEPAAVKAIDRRLCVTEKRDVLRQRLKPEDANLEPLHSTISPVCARDAEDLFLRRFQELFA